MTEEQIEGTIRDVDAMTEIATGIKPDKVHDELSRRMLRGEITLSEALERTIENVKGKYNSN